MCVCVCDNFVSLSTPFKTMLYGGFIKSIREKINFSKNGFLAEAIRAIKVLNRIKRYPRIVLELLSFVNRFCCDEIKSACDSFHRL